MSAPEFARPLPLAAIGTQPQLHRIAAEPDELLALARRFGVLDVSLLSAAFEVARVGEGVRVNGNVDAKLTQACTVSGEPICAVIAEPVTLRFAPEAGLASDAEVELDADELDTLPLGAGGIDLGEIAAETMALALDPYPRAPGADEAASRAKLMSEADAEAVARAASPFAALRPKA